MQSNDAFKPKYFQSTATTFGSLIPSVTIAATTVAASAGLPAGSGLDSGNQIQIANTSASWAYVNFGFTPANVVAATVAASYPVGPGAVVVVTVNREVDAVSVILSTGTGNVIFTRGDGV